MYRLLLTLCLGEFVFPAIDTAAAAPPATSCALYAQQGGGLAERFKQLDRNGDGKLSHEEAGSAPFFRAADKDGDGFLTFAEAEAHARQSAGPAHSRTAGMEGDGAGRMTSRVRPVEIPETESPIQTLEAKAADGRTVRAFWRKPKSEGTLPAIVFIHGGLTQFPEDLLRRQLLVNPVITRMLAAGYAVAQATFRTYEQDVQSRGPIEDVRAVVRTLAETPGIDGQRIALFGGSGGGSIALELGGDPAVRAIVAGEPATVLYTGMLATGEYGPRLEIMANPEKFFTPELRERTRAKLKTVRAPVLILHGDRHDLHKLNAPLFVPMMKEAGVRVEYREYPGYGHGFYFGGGDDRWGKGADDKVVAEVVRDVRAFLEKEIPADDRPPNAGNHQPWVTPPVRAPGVDFRTFESRAAQARVSFHIYTPAAYGREQERRFPVLYWLHGSGGGLRGIPPLARHFDSAIAAGKAPPFLAVFVNRKILGGMLTELDVAIGRVMDKVREQQQEENTLVMFYSDNGGPTSNNASLNTPLRGFKAQFWEGGIREPFVFQWKGVIPAGQPNRCTSRGNRRLSTTKSCHGPRFPRAWETCAKQARNNPYGANSPDVIFSVIPPWACFGRGEGLDCRGIHGPPRLLSRRLCRANEAPAPLAHEGGAAQRRRRPPTGSRRRVARR